MPRDTGPDVASASTGRTAREIGPGRTLLVAASVCLVCSMVVCAVEILLRPRRMANQERERKAHLVAIVKSIPGITDLIGTVDALALEARVVNLASGAFVNDIDAEAYDQRRAAEDPERSIKLPSDRDTAELGRLERHAVVYLLYQEKRIRLIILPVRGVGYQSVLRGYLALDGDTNTILGLTFYEQNETPGLGTQVTNPGWLARWRGKRVRDETGAIRIEVTEEKANPGSPFEVDGISGATVTSLAVSTLIGFWMGPDGFGPFLKKVGAQ